MKQDQLAKLYQNLTNKERAALAFRYLVDGNEIELERVDRSAKHFTYRLPDAEYRARYDSIFNMAALFGIEHWKLRHRTTELLNALHISMNGERFGDARQVLMLHCELESRLLAIDGALDAICAEHGVDPDAARKISEMDRYVPSDNRIKPHAAYQEQWQQAFARLLSGAA